MLVFVSPLVRAATVRHVLRHVTLLVRALLCEPLFFNELFVRPRADPRVFLVVRWLRHQPAHSSSPRAARGVVAFFRAVACNVVSDGGVLLSSWHSMSPPPWFGTVLLRRGLLRHCSGSRRHPALVRSR